MQDAYVREGMAGIVLNNNKICFDELPVMGRDQHGELINRVIYIDESAPQWFVKIVTRHVNTGSKVRIRIKELKGSTVATAVPCVETMDEFLSDSRLKSEQVLDFEYAKRAHEIFADKHNLQITEHLCDKRKVHSLAIDKATGRQVTICRGIIVSKLKNYIQSGKAKLEDVIDTYVRVGESVH